MLGFTSSEVCLAVNGKIINNANKDFCGVSTDTRKINNGDLFIALVGEKFDGHDFIDTAIQNGVHGVIVSRSDITIAKNITVILVDDTLKALQGLACFHRKRFDIPVVAITGSNGKTTTKDMTAAILGSKFNVLKTEANYNNEIGLPLTLYKLNAQHEAAVVEMGMRGLGQIRELVNIALPTIAVVTNVGETHMELLGSLENIAQAKAEILETLTAEKLAVLNGDDIYVRKMGDKVNSRVVFIGLGENNDIKAQNIEFNNTGINFECICSLGAFPVFIPAIGKHNVYNALVAIAIGLELGLSFAEIKAGLENFAGSSMRLYIKKFGEYTVINDAYNASPMSMCAAIDTLKEMKGRKVAVLGDMLELGHIAVEAHQQIGEKLAENNIDIVVTVGDLAKHIAAAASKRGIANVFACNNHDEAIAVLQQVLLPGDTILLKGSRGMNMENIIKMF